MNLENLIGQTLDSKYLIEKELGHGGMGAVYLATHVGTERPVAVKVIVPQFMQRAEFVERFRREARAAGRLRHPNVVNVTDFGITDAGQGRVAYLVMEYLDGCTLGEILEEEKQLPLSWTLDILEQVCSAVHEAHGQGIIHRDLKPDNIWLEPNQRGGYTVKVLDFGIAKLEEPMSSETETPLLNPTTTTPTQSFQQGETISESENARTIIENRNSTVVGEAGTLIQSEASESGTAILSIDKEGGTVILPSAEVSSEDGTAIFPKKGTQLIEKDEKGTRLLSTEERSDNSLANLPAKDLTRVGAVLGTPLYMSPEQCRGEKLSPRSDIYSLAIIVYQMLSGKTPFEGDFTEVMDAHKEVEPPPLDTKKIPRKVKKILFSALAKDKDERPQTAEGFASELRAHSEGIGKLLQRALVLYSEHLPKFLLLALITFSPILLLTVVRVTFNFLRAGGVFADNSISDIVSGCLSILAFFLQIITSAVLVGTTTWIVAQILAVPLREFSLRNALKEVKKRWKPLSKTVTASTLLAFASFGAGGLISLIASLIIAVPIYYWVSKPVAYIVAVVLTVLGGIGLGVIVSSRYMLIAPSIMMEDVSGLAAFRRSAQLVKRSFLTVLGTAVLVYFVPGLLVGIMGFLIGNTVKNLDRDLSSSRDGNPPIVKTEDNLEAKEEDFNVSYRGGNGVEITRTDDKKEDKPKKMRPVLAEGIFELIWTPFLVFIASFTSVITALIYFKTRRAGGESMQDLLAKFEDAEHPRSNWQHRIRERLIQSGRVSSTERK